MDSIYYDNENRKLEVDKYNYNLILHLEIISCVVRKCYCKQAASLQNFGPSVISDYMPLLFQLIMIMNTCLLSTKTELPNIAFKNNEKLQEMFTVMKSQKES